MLRREVELGVREMTDRTWLRRALLSGVSLCVLSAAAWGDELSDLKAQLEALQGRVSELERQPMATSAPGEGASLLTVSRGQGSFARSDGLSRARRDDIPEDRGFTISVTPTADIPAPVAEVTVYGYVKGDVIYDFDKHDTGDTFYVPNIWSMSGRNDAGVRLHAKQSRFGIRSKVDTAVGQVRTMIEADFMSDDSHLRLRHAWGEWDMAPSWTFGAGQTWQTASLLPLGVTEVDDEEDAGPLGYTRRAQVRLTYHSGPISWAVAAERPTFQSEAEWPNFASYFQYDAGDGTEFLVTGVVADWDNDNPDVGPHRDVGWAVQAGANINLADIATLTFGGIYGQGESCNYLNQTLAWCEATDADKDGSDDFAGSEDSYGAFAGVSFNLSDTTSLNLQGGWSRLDNGIKGSQAETIKRVDVYTAHGNILWQPVKQMRLGWEVMWGQYDWDARTGPGGFDGNAKRKDDGIRAQFGAWFYF